MNKIVATFCFALLAGSILFVKINNSYVSSTSEIPRILQVREDGVTYDVRVTVLDSTKIVMDSTKNVKQKDAVTYRKSDKIIDQSDILFHHNPPFLIWTILI